MKKLIVPLLGATALSLAAAGTASAADILVRPPAPPPPVIAAPVAAYNWSGPYLGIQGGWDTNDFDFDNGGSTFSANGGLVGLYGGYNFMLTPSFLLGIDASINYDWARVDDEPYSNTGESGVDWKGFLRGRAGFTFDRFLIYGTFGGVWQHEFFNTDGQANSSATPFGWTAGLGAEMAISQNLTARVDWAYQQFGSHTINGGYWDGYDVKSTANTITLGLGMKF